MTQPLEPISNYAMPRVTDTQIICGNCCGDAEAPRLTLETEDKTCAGCGGRIYIVVPDQRGSSPTVRKGVNQTERTNRNDANY